MTLRDISVFWNGRNLCKISMELELGGTQILETVRYFIKYLGINNYYDILINTFMYPVKYSNNYKAVPRIRCE